MRGISILADKNVAEYLKPPMKIRILVAVDRDEAMRRFNQLRRDEYTSIIIVSSKVLNWIEQTLARVGKRERCPLVVSLLSKGNTKAKARYLSQLIEKISMLNSAVQRL